MATSATRPRPTRLRIAIENSPQQGGIFFSGTIPPSRVSPRTRLDIVGASLCADGAIPAMDFFWRSVKRVRETRRSQGSGSRRTLAAWVQQLERRELLSLKGISTQVNFTAGASPPSTVIIGSFFDSDVTEPATDFAASINWGDQSTSACAVSPTPGVPGRFDVSGSHVYAAPGTYTATISLQSNTGQSVTITSTAVASAAQVFAFSGGLAPVPSNGPNAAFGYTNTNRPTFSGTAPLYSTVQLFARPSSLDVNEPLGYAIASTTGQWNLATGPLADGIYSVTAIVTPSSGYPGPVQPLANNGRVVIDTVAPKVVRIANSGAGQVTVYFRDDLSGMNFTSLSNTSNYAFAGPRRLGFSPTSATVVPAGSLPTDVVGVVLTIPGNRRTWAMVQGLRITGTNPVGGAGGANLGITDNAGNPLQGYYGKLVSSASGRAGGNYHVKIRVPVFHGKRH